MVVVVVIMVLRDVSDCDIKMWCHGKIVIVKRMVIYKIVNGDLYILRAGHVAEAVKGLKELQADLLHEGEELKGGRKAWAGAKEMG